MLTIFQQARSTIHSNIIANLLRVFVIKNSGVGKHLRILQNESLPSRRLPIRMLIEVQHTSSIEQLIMAFIMHEHGLSCALRNRQLEVIFVSLVFGDTLSCCRFQLRHETGLIFA